MWVRNSQTKTLLSYLAMAGGIAVFSLLAPTLPHQLLRAYVRNKRFARKKFLQDIRRLQQRDLLESRVLSDGSIEMKLRKRGKREILRYHIEDIRVRMPARWDGVWRLVMFDIPNHKSGARRAFQAKLRELGFYPLQKSVLIHPFPCEKEIDFLASFFHVGNHLLVLRVSRFEGEEKLKHHFHI